MLFELRQYHVRPGQQANWVTLMEQEIIPFQTRMGMEILGSFVGEDDDSVYVWIRRFESEFLGYMRHSHKETLDTIAGGTWNDDVIAVS